MKGIAWKAWFIGVLVSMAVTAMIIVLTRPGEVGAAIIGGACGAVGGGVGQSVGRKETQ